MRFEARGEDVSDGGDAGGGRTVGERAGGEVSSNSSASVVELGK